MNLIVRLTIAVIIITGGICQAGAAESGETYDYLFVLPFQHSYYQPIDAMALGQGNALDLARGPSALFGNPARMSDVGRYHLALAASNIAEGRSSLSVSTGASNALPSLAAVSYDLGTSCFSLGWRRAMKAALEFPDVQNPLVTDLAQLSLEQYAAGWSLSAIKHLVLGISLCLSRFDFEWRGPNGTLAAGRGSGPCLAAGLSTDLGQDFWFSAGFRSKSEMSCITDFYGDTTGGKLKLAGAVPQAGWVSLSYFPEEGFETFAGMELTGWHLVSSGYLEQTDFHLGCRIELPWNRLELSCGCYSLKHPLDPFLRRNDPFLQDLFFLTGGVACRMGPLRLTVSGASSRPLSGEGMNQNILSGGLEYLGKPL